MSARPSGSEPITPEHVLALRLARQQSREQAAAAIGVHVRTWYRWEAGEVTPDPRAIRDYEATPVPSEGQVAE